jgi:hypothetical protein
MIRAKVAGFECTKMVAETRAFMVGDGRHDPPAFRVVITHAGGATIGPIDITSPSSFALLVSSLAPPVLLLRCGPGESASTILFEIREFLGPDNSDCISNVVLH